jgi:hypothetical protein
MKKKCNFDEFRAFIQLLGFAGQWDDDTSSFHTFRTDSGGVINWWPSTGTIDVQGKKLARPVVRSAIATLLSLTRSSTSSSNSDATEPADQSKIEPANDSDESGWSTFHAIVQVKKAG